MDERNLKEEDAFQLLELYMPKMFKIFNKDDKFRKIIIKSYIKRYDQMATGIENDGIFRSQTTMFDLLWNASESKDHANVFLKFIDDIIHNVYDKLSIKMKHQLRNLVLTVFTSFNANESQYKHHLAEICVLNKILNDTRFKLLEIEKKLENGKTIDFLLENSEIENNKETLVEVYNINFNIEKIENPKIFKEFLIKRLEKKVNDKLRGVKIDELSFMLIPVLWGEIKEIENYIGTILEIKDYKIVSPIMMIAQYKDYEGNILYDFQPVDFFIKKVKEIKRNKQI